MAYTPQTLGVFGALVVGTRKYTFTGGRFTCPVNWNVPGIVGNAYQFVFSEGLRQPSIELTILARDLLTGDGSVFDASGILSYLFARGSTPEFNTTQIGADMPSSIPAVTATTAGVEFSDGASLIKMYGCKLDSFSLSTAKGGDLGISVRIYGTGFWIYEPGTSGLQARIDAITPSVISQAAPLRFQSVCFSSDATFTSIADGSTTTLSLADKIYGFTFTWSNGHEPNMALNCSVFPVAIDAGLPTSSLSLRVQAKDFVPRGVLLTLPIRIESKKNPGSVATILVQSALCQNPDDRGSTLGRVMRDYQFVNLGAGGATPNASSAAPAVFTPMS